MRPEFRFTFLVAGLALSAACRSEPLTADASAECLQKGLAAVRVPAANASTSFAVECRRIRHIRLGGMRDLHIVRLVAGGESVPLEIAAVDTAGQALSDIAVSSVVRDTSVAVVRDGRIYPRAPGQTVIDLLLGCKTSIIVTVYGNAPSSEALRPGELYSDTVVLSPGEHRFWKLAVGTYRVEVSPAYSPTRAVLSTFAARCRVPYRDGDFSCTTEPGGSIVLRNPHRAATSGRITIIRTDGPPLRQIEVEASRRTDHRATCAEVIG